MDLAFKVFSDDSDRTVPFQFLKGQGVKGQVVKGQGVKGQGVKGH